MFVEMSLIQFFRPRRGRMSLIFNYLISELTFFSKKTNHPTAQNRNRTPPLSQNGVPGVK
jgi:hypothetical protein